MVEYYLAGGGLRLWQVIIYSSMWVVIGCLIAAVFRRMLGPTKLKRIFADDTRWGLVTGWLIGMLLPVCSLGVIPIVRELHRAGVKRGTIVAFGLTAPLFNPMSVLYGLTLSDPIAILSFSLCALVIVSLLGWCWGKMVTTGEESVPEDNMPTVGIQRTISVLYTASKELVGPSGVYIAIGILASMALAILLPKGYLQSQVEVDNAMAPVTVALVATPIYSTPLLAMSQIGGMFQHGNSIGAAFSLLILGAGTNIGLFCWFGATYGVRRVLLFYLMLAATTVGLAYVIDKPLYPKGVEPAGHSHAFDVYTHPFFKSETEVGETAKNEAQNFWRTNEFGGTYMLMMLIVLGVVFTVSERFIDYESWFVKEDTRDKKMDMIIPGWLLGVTVVVGLIAASVVGCYLYYPAPDDLLGDLSAVNTEAVACARTEQWEAADKWIRYADDLSRRLEVGYFLRNGFASEYQTTKAKLYREKLDRLKEAVDNRWTEEAKDWGMDVYNAYLRLNDSFREGGTRDTESTDGDSTP
ncbi:MAG: permease [Planctomycetota bacterium]